MRRLSHRPRTLQTCGKYRYSVVKPFDYDRGKDVTVAAWRWDWLYLRLRRRSPRLALYQALDRLYPGAAFEPDWKMADYLQHEIAVCVTVYRQQGERVEHFALVVRILPA